MLDDHGWKVPFKDTQNTVRILERQAARYVPEVVGALKNRRVCVQAGGNVGIYPRALSQYFEHVWTFEAHSGNFLCMRQNLEDRGVSNVSAWNIALGESAGAVRLDEDANNIGKHKAVVDPNGDVAMTKIDSIGSVSVDLIWLDVEGFEVNVLRGAEATIEVCRPLVVVEDVFVSDEGETPQAWLESRGYVLLTRLHNDLLFKPADGEDAA